MSAFNVQATISAKDATGPALNAVRAKMRALAAETKKLNDLRAKAGMDPITSGWGAAAAARFGKAVTQTKSFTSAIEAQNAALATNARRLRATLRQFDALSRHPAVSSAGALSLPIADRRRNAAYSQRRAGPYSAFPSNVGPTLAYRMAHGTISAGSNAARSGGRGLLDASDQRTLTSLHNLGPQLTAALERESEAQARRYTMLTAASMQEIGRGALGNLKDAGDFPDVMRETAKSAQVMASLYGDAAKGAEASRKYSRAADLSGMMGNAGDFRTFMEAITRANLVAERDVDPTVLSNNFRRMGLARFGMNGQFVGDVVNLTDEMQQKAGLVLSQFHRELTASNVSKKDRAAQRASGLRDGRDNVVDSSLFQANKFDWVEKYVVPKLLAAGADLNRSDQVQKAGSRLGLKSGALEAVLMYAEKRDEIAQNRRRRAQINYSDSRIEGLSHDNLRGSLKGVESQFQNFADAMTRRVQPTVSRVLGGIADLLAYGSGSSGLATARSGSALAGLGLAGGAVALRHIVENPGQSANTSALGILTGAVLANTAVQRGGLLGRLLGGGAAGGAAAAGGSRALTGGALAASNAMAASRMSRLMAANGLTTRAILGSTVGMGLAAYEAGDAIAETFKNVKVGEQHNFGRRTRKVAEELGGGGVNRLVQDAALMRQSLAGETDETERLKTVQRIAVLEKRIADLKGRSNAGPFGTLRELERTSAARQGGPVVTQQLKTMVAANAYLAARESQLADQLTMTRTEARKAEEQRNLFKGDGTPAQRERRRLAGMTTAQRRAEQASKGQQEVADRADAVRKAVEPFQSVGSGRLAATATAGRFGLSGPQSDQKGPSSIADGVREQANRFSDITGRLQALEQSFAEQIRTGARDGGTTLQQAIAEGGKVAAAAISRAVSNITVNVNGLPGATRASFRNGGYEAPGSTSA